MVCSMISYQPLWATMKNRGISRYKLIKEYHFSTGQLDRLRKNESVSTNTLDTLCRILNCNIDDIVVYTPDNVNKASPLC